MHVPSAMIWPGPGFRSLPLLSSESVTVYSKMGRLGLKIMDPTAASCQYPNLNQ